MTILQDNVVPKTNRPAILSLLTGILSVLPYLPAGTAILFNAIFETDTLLQITTFIPVTAYAISGLLFGTISLMLGGRAIEQIRGSGNDGKGHGLAVTGRVLGIAGILMNVLFGLLFVLLLRMSFE